MSIWQPVPSRPRSTVGNRTVSPSFALLLCLGAAIGTVVALGLYGTKPVYVLLLPAALAAILPSVFVKDFRLYWFGVFLFSLQFAISKNLNDGLAVINALHIDYTIWNFTFDITASDLALVVLVAIWANDIMFHGKPVRFPPVTWLAVGYLGICLLSTIAAPSPYLGFVEIWRQMKFFVVYLFAVNCLNTKSAVRVLAMIGVITLAIQAGTTIARFETGYLTPFSFGQTETDLSAIKQYLAVDRSDEGSVERGYGTLESPGSTVRLCMMVIPFALFLCVPNAMFRMRLAFAAATIFGLLGLALSFTRVYYITTAVQIVLAFMIMLRDRMVKREEAVVAVLLGVATLAIASPQLYKQFTVREDSVSVRLLQYETTMKMILDHPFLGVGLNNGTGQKPNYVNVTYNQNDPDTQFYMEPTHNVYLSMASEIGIPGVLFFVAFFAKTALAAWRQSRLSPDPQIRWVANVLVVVFCGVAMNSLMDPLPEYSVLVLLWMYAGLSLNLPGMANGLQIAKTGRDRRA